MDSMKKPYDESLERQMRTYFDGLSELDRRHYSALESLKLGRGGQTYISELLGISRPVIIKGRRELQHPELLDEISPGKQRRAGGGRKKKKKAKAT